MNKKLVISVIVLAGLGVMALAVVTARSMRPLPQSLALAPESARGPVLLDRNGERISGERSEWNLDEMVPLHQIPEFMRRAFILSEDKRFYSHNGVDWLARLHALGQCIWNMKAVRGASTITEQVVKMLHKRPRSGWTRWVEGFEAAQLERTVSKVEILEFYMNQVPYASNRRGVAQAARYYFNRELDSLSKKEMLALAILPRRPTGYDLYKHPGSIDRQIKILGGFMEGEGLVSLEERRWIEREPIRLEGPESGVDTYHFTRHVMDLIENLRLPGGKIRTTLDMDLQRDVVALLDERMKALSGARAVNAAALVVDQSTGEILAWVSHGDRENDHPGSYLDAVLTPRQPGSSLKPLLYAMALESGWTAATILDDAPLDTKVGAGLHSFRNYSRTFYGPVTLRDALANSLNIPAVLTLRQVGGQRYLELLRSLGIDSLDQAPGFYGDALALGVGEAPLYQVTQAYTALANRGVALPLTALMEPNGAMAARRIFSEETASIIGDILSDRTARRLEFGSSGAMSLAQGIAVKTGTSTGYHDAWAFGYDSRWLVGVWIGSLSREPSAGLTGASGPAMLLQSIFARMNRKQRATPMYLSPRLARERICQEGVQIRREYAGCLGRDELFAPGTFKAALDSTSVPARRARLTHPVEGLLLAMDPRTPEEDQAVEFRVEGLKSGERVEWKLDGHALGVTADGRLVWPLRRGGHSLEATVLGSGRRTELAMGPVDFYVK
ncbi:MAG: transglycosylase domain-containing protein [Nitrospinota bacterium]|nr:transglycosylase domain-containing protein [Nitrospinota bacterium]